MRLLGLLGVEDKLKCGEAMKIKVAALKQLTYKAKGFQGATRESSLTVVEKKIHEHLDDWKTQALEYMSQRDQKSKYGSDHLYVVAQLSRVLLVCEIDEKTQKVTAAAVYRHRLSMPYHLRSAASVLPSNDR